MTARISSSTEDTTTNPFYKYMNEQEMELYQIIMEYILRKKTNDVERNTRQWSSYLTKCSKVYVVHYLV